MTDLTSKAMLCHLNRSVWTAHKHDRQITREVHEKHQTGADAGRYNKRLLDRYALKGIEHAARAAYRHHIDKTHPWLQEGARILPSAVYFEYAEEQRRLKIIFDDEVNAFLPRYDEFKARARNLLGGTYREADYPPVQKLRRKFDLSITIFPLPDAQDWRVALGADEDRKIRQNIEQEMRCVFSNCTTECWKRLYQVVKRMADQFIDTDKRIFDAHIQNVRDLCALLPKLNIEGDSQLEQMCLDIKHKLGHFDAEAYRSSDNLRAATAREAVAMLDAMAGYIGDAA